MSNYDGKIEPLPIYNNQGNEHYLSSDKPDTYLWLADENTKQANEIKLLQEQLKEANEIIANFRTYDFTINDEIAEEYQVKYGIAGEKIYTNKKPSKEFERWRKKITKSFEKKLKSGV